MHTIVKIRCVLLFSTASWALAASPTLAADSQVVGFDIPSAIIAQQMQPESASVPTMGGRLVRLRIPVSTFISSEFRGSVQEYIVEIESPWRTMRAVDFWPRREVYSEIEGTVHVERKRQHDAQVSLNASGGLEPFVKGTVGGKLAKNTSTHEKFERKPPLQILTSSGTIRRGYGVFFKFRAGPTPNTEGVREVAILAEVPADWRADMLQVSLKAVGSLVQGGRTITTLGHARLWTTLHLHGDRLAAERARKFLVREQALRRVAAANHQRVIEKSLPTIWHKVGAALDVVEPRIPQNYLDQVIFGPSANHLSSGNRRLPVDVRVAILDYWDARDELMELAYGNVRPVDFNPAGTHLMSNVN